MVGETPNSVRKVSTELIAILAIGVAVLGQAAWLDGKIERQGDRLNAKIEREISGLDAKIEHKLAGLDAKIEHELAGLDAKIEREVGGLRKEFREELRLSVSALDNKFEKLQNGQADIRSRLARLEAHVGIKGPDIASAVGAEAAPP